MNEKLQNITPSEASGFIFDGMVVDAKVYSIYDGDTIRCIFPFKGEFLKYSVRLDGIDTPEMRGGSTNEHDFALKIRDWLRKMILDKIVILELLGFDKYGRILANVFYEKRNINKYS